MYSSSRPEPNAREGLDSNLDIVGPTVNKIAVGTKSRFVFVCLYINQLNYTNFQVSYIAINEKNKNIWNIIVSF